MAYVKGEKMESGIWRLADKEDLILGRSQLLGISIL